jgi:hypothetical protein
LKVDNTWRAWGDEDVEKVYEADSLPRSSIPSSAWASLIEEIRSHEAIPSAYLARLACSSKPSDQLQQALEYAKLSFSSIRGYWSGIKEDTRFVYAANHPVEERRLTRSYATHLVLLDTFGVHLTALQSLYWATVPLLAKTSTDLARGVDDLKALLVSSTLDFVDVLAEGCMVR